MEAVSPGLSKPVIRIKISSVLVSIHKMLLFTDCKSTQFNPIKLSLGILFLDGMDEFMLYNIFLM